MIYINKKRGVIMLPNNNFFTLNQEELVDLKIYQVGSERCEPNKSYGPIKRNHYLFHYIYQGKGHFEYTNAKGEVISAALTENCGFLCSPDQVCTYIADKDDPWVYAWVELDGIHVSRYFANAGLTYDFAVFRLNNKQYEKVIKDTLFSITQSYNHSTLQFLSYIYTLLDALEQGASNKRTNLLRQRNDDYVRNAILFIEHNYKRDITIKDVADFCLLNQTYLGRIFKSATKKGIKEFLIDYRLTKSTDLLRDTNLSINEVAADVGYTNQLHFSKSFKHKYQMTPTSWRNIHHVV